MRFLMRIHDPLKQWKLSPMDLESRRRWELYTKAKEEMLERTHIPESRWWVVEGVDKKKARLNCIHHLLQQVPYQEVQHTEIVLPDREHKPDYTRHPVRPISTCRAFTSVRADAAASELKRGRRPAFLRRTSGCRQTCGLVSPERVKPASEFAQRTFTFLPLFGNHAGTVVPGYGFELEAARKAFGKGANAARADGCDDQKRRSLRGNQIGALTFWRTHDFSRRPASIFQLPCVKGESGASQKSRQGLGHAELHLRIERRVRPDRR